MSPPLLPVACCFGLLMLYPAAAQPPAAQPVSITGVKVLLRAYNEAPALQGEPSRDTKTEVFQKQRIKFVPGNEVLQLNEYQNNILIQFSGSRQGRPPYFAYAAEGLYTDTIRTSDNFLVLTDLPYNQEINLSIFSLHYPQAAPARLRIEVIPPFWQRWWFLLLVAAFGLSFIGIVVYFFFRYRLRQFMRLQRVREVIARNLHDDLGSYLSSISIMSQTASRLTDSSQTHLTLDTIGKTARQMMESMGDIVWSINPEEDAMEHVLARMKDVAYGLFSFTTETTPPLTAVRWLIQPDVMAVSLPAEQRRDFFLIFKEALTNVARYARAREVVISLELNNNCLQLSINDDGTGFDPAQPARLNPSGGNGLRNMQARAEQLQGHLRIRSAAGRGTQVQLDFPLA